MMKNSMEKIKLSDIAKINGTTFYTKDFDEILYLDTSSVTKGVFDDFIHLSKNDKIPSRAKRAIKNNTIVYSTVRPNLEHFGIFNKPKENVVVSTGFATIDVKEGKADPKFVYYNLAQSKFTNVLHTIATNNVSSYPSINPSDLEKLELEFPPLLIQKQIATLLSSLDNKIALNARINDNLEAMAKTLYDYWFAQNADKNWERSPIGEIVNIIRGVTYTKDVVGKVYNKNIPILRATNISNNEIDLNNMVYVPEKYISENQILNQFDILITMSSGSKEHIGKNAFYYFDENVSFGAFCSRLEVKEEYKFLLKVFMNSLDFKNYVKNVCLGTNINNLNNSHITECRMIKPDNHTLKKFNQIIKPLFYKIQKNQQESLALHHLRDWLLPMLMNGQVSVNYHLAVKTIPQTPPSTQ
jgi:type I restriction enzyme S subunit